MATEEMAGLYNAIAMLTQQVQIMAEQANQRGGGGGRKPWDHYERFKSLKIFDGDVKEFEEWSVKFRSQVAAADTQVSKLMKAVEASCTEEVLAKGKYDELIPEYGEEDGDFIMKTSAEMYNVLLNITTGEANAVVRRSLGSGWLAWKRLTSSLNPRTLASGIKSISAALNPQKIATASKADSVVDEWEDKLVKLQTEYGQVLTNKMKVAVLYSMMPKDLQEKVLDACAVAWDGTSETDAGQLYEKVKAQIKNLAKARREMQGPKPMEVDRISTSWADWSEEWDGGWGNAEETTAKDDDCDHNHEEANIQYIGKGDGKSKGKGGFQGHCFVCGEFGHSQWDCPKGKRKGKGFGKEGYKGFGKGGYKGNFGYKGFGKDGYKGSGKDGWYGKGKGSEYGKGGPTLQRACFGCGATDHVFKDCPKNPNNIQQVQQEEEPEILFIGHVRDDWKHVPMKIGVPGGRGCHPRAARAAAAPVASPNGFRVLDVDEEENDEGMNVFAVSAEAPEQECEIERHQVDGGKAGEGNHWAAAEWPRSAITQQRKRWCTNVNDQENFEGGMKKLEEEVAFVRAVEKSGCLLNLGKGDIIVDSAADESCWPVGQGDAYETFKSKKDLRLRTANGGEMKHYGEKHITFRYRGGENKDPVGLKFQVTDVRKPLLAVRRLVEKGNVVVLSDGEGESYIMNKEAKVRIPIVKKGGSFVVEAEFVRGFTGRA